MLFRRRGRTQPARSARCADGGADRGGRSGRPGIGDAHRAARDALRHPGLGPVCGDPLGQRRDASGVRSPPPARPCSSGRRSRPANGSFLFTQIAGTDVRAGGGQPRHRLGRPAWSTGALHLQRRVEPRCLPRRRSPSFRQQLVGWFAGAGAAAGATLALLLRWLLQPMRRLEREIKEVEAGGREQLGEDWPQRAERRHQQPQRAARVGERTRIKRYRDTLGNLAHSLKTPLAVMRQALQAVAHRTSVGARCARSSA